MIAVELRVFDGSVAMRRFLLTAAMAVTAAGAHAADMPDFLRGTLPAASAPTRNWDGWYVGGQVGYSSVSDDFSGSLSGLANQMYAGTVLESVTSNLNPLGKATGQGAGFGGFVGRNYQWDDIVLGVEANYNYVSLKTSATNSTPTVQYSFPGPVTNSTSVYNVRLSGTAAAQVTDAIAFRGRAGWAVGDFLPYAFGGVAVGRIDVSRAASSNASRQDYLTTTTTDPITGVTTTTTTAFGSSQNVSAALSQGRTNNFVPGWTAGLGFEYMMCGNLFLRGEWEYTKFLSVEDTVVTMNSVHAGIGYKF